jgi:hypothetical protein
MNPILKNVRIFVGAEHAYACAEFTNGGSCDIQLRAGKSAPQSLRESAAETRARADHLRRFAKRQYAMADWLESNKETAP